MVKVPKNRTIASRVDYSDYLNSAEIDRQRYRGMIDHLFVPAVPGLTLGVSDMNLEYDRASADQEQDKSGSEDNPDQTGQTGTANV